MEENLILMRCKLDRIVWDLQLIPLERTDFHIFHRKQKETVQKAAQAAGP
jgi:hypothetical protein